MRYLINNEVGVCVICCSKVYIKNRSFYDSVKDQTDDDFLCTNLYVIFVLQKLLQVPNFNLKCNLLELGNPESWISVCSHCSKLTKRAWKLHQKVVQFNQELKSIKNTVIERAKSSCLPQNVDDFMCVSTSPSADEDNEQVILSTKKRVWKITRDFITNRKNTIFLVVW